MNDKPHAAAKVSRTATRTTVTPDNDNLGMRNTRRLRIAGIVLGLAFVNVTAACGGTELSAVADMDTERFGELFEDTMWESSEAIADEYSAWGVTPVSAAGELIDGDPLDMSPDAVARSVTRLCDDLYNNGGADLGRRDPVTNEPEQFGGIEAEFASALALYQLAAARGCPERLTIKIVNG